MMAVEAVKIRKLDPWILEAHRAKAEAEGISLEEELRRVVTEAALRPRNEFVAKAAKLHAELKAKYGEMSDSTEIIREEREERN